MRAIVNQMKVIAIILVSLMLFQSCRVYHKGNVSLDEAITQQKRVKIKTKDGRKLKFKSVVIDSSQYYGIKKIRGKTVRTLIEPNNIETLRLHNKTMSIIYGTGIGLVVTGFVTVVIALASWSGPNIPVGIQF